MNKAFYFILILIVSFWQVNAQEKHFQMGVDYLQANNKDYLVVSFNNDKGWHSYWKNPGDAGLPVIIKLLPDSGLKLKELSWPVPHTYIQEGILSYGYSGEYSLFYEVNPQHKSTLTKSPITVQSQVLICNQICIPGSESVQIQLQPNNTLKTMNATSALKMTPSKQELAKRLKALPTQKILPKEMTTRFVQVDEDLYLHSTYPSSLIESFHFESNFVTPYTNKYLALMKEDLYIDNKAQVVHSLIKVEWEGEYNQPPVDIKQIKDQKMSFNIDYLLQHQGLFIKTSSKIKNIVNYSQAQLNNIKSLEKFSSTSKTSKTNQSIALVVLFAFLGGLILNLMPCVLPVISIKLFGLINSRGEDNQSRLLKHNLTYTLGVLTTFMVLAGIIHIIKSTGQQVGWGFQLQSPSFVFFMVLIIFFMGLNMIGVFEFQAPGGRKLGGANLKDNFSGDFFSGVISTILSTPCSAPFLGSALTFAFTTSTLNIYLIFLCIGLGLALPFILIGFFPKLISFLPKPGMWMQKLKYVLGIALFITSLWLLSVFYSLTQSGLAIIYSFVIMGISTIALWVKNKKISTALMVFSVFGLGLFFQQSLHKGLTTRSLKTTNNKWKSWMPEVMESTSKKSLKFINFTADWCLTCKVNKKLTLDRDNFYEFSRKHQIELYEADWTRRDEDITKWLAKYNVVGVPAYFLQNAQGEIIHLGETTSIDEIKERLNL